MQHVSGMARDMATILNAEINLINVLNCELDICSSNRELRGRYK